MYVLSNLGEFGALPSNCSRVGTIAIGKLQEKLKARRYDIGPSGVDCRYGSKTNEALTKFVNWRLEQPPTETFTREMAREGKNYLIELGLSAAEADSAFETIRKWILEKPSERTSPFKKVAEIALATSTGTPTGTGTGTPTEAGQSHPIRISPGAGLVAQTGTRSPKPGTQESTQLPAAPPVIPEPGPEALASDKSAEPWYAKYKWHIIAGSAFLVLATIVTVTVTRRN